MILWVRNLFEWMREQASRAPPSSHSQSEIVRQQIESREKDQCETSYRRSGRLFTAPQIHVGWSGMFCTVWDNVQSDEDSGFGPHRAAFPNLQNLSSRR